MLAIRALMKTSDILRAKTVMTGAKITLTTLATLKCFLRDSPILSARPNACRRTKNGESTMTARINPTLMISTIANASRGKNNQIANHTLMSISPPISPNDVSLLVFASCEKSSIEEYIVISGPTNHLDLSTILSSVRAAELFCNRVSPYFEPYSVEFSSPPAMKYC